MKKSMVIIIIIFILVISIVLLIPNNTNNYIKAGKLYISKILAKNYSLKEDNNHEYSDYIEIYNGYDYQIKLDGYHLSDSEFLTDKWTFPNITINPNEYLIVYASGEDYCDIVDRICHTNFKLNDKGEVITFTDKHGNIINKFDYPVQYPDIYYGYLENKYTYIKEDGKTEYKEIKGNNYKLEITEYMTHNKSIIYDSHGNYYDWVEIHNYSNEDYILEGVYITDDINNLRKYQINKSNLKKDDYLVIYLAGEKKDYQDGIYADFKISEKDEYIIISNGEKIIDKVKIINLADNISYGKYNKSWKYYPNPTPGKINNTASFDSWGGNNDT